MATRNPYAQDLECQLIGIPRPVGFESPVSWLARAALSQGTGVNELLRLFNVRRTGDIDLNMSGATLAMIASRCSLPAEDFGLSLRMFVNLRRIDPQGRVFLMSKNRSPRYRYCPVCLHQSRTKHFMLHWRFTAWRHCHLHKCLMDEQCRACGESVVLPTDMLTAGPEKSGIASLDLCMKCGHRLSSHWMSAFGTIDEHKVSDWEWSQLVRGRALLAAIYHGGVFYAQGMDGKQSIRELLKLERKGLFPNKNFFLTAEEAEARQQGRGRTYQPTSLFQY